MNASIATIESEIRQCFGSVPSFFQLAMDTPDVAADLWRHAQSAYLDNEIPFALRERLFLHLSQFCKVNYCLARHTALLLSPNVMAGACEADRLTADQILDLLKMPAPDRARVEQATRALEKQEPRAEWPEPDSIEGKALFSCCAAIFLRYPDAERCRVAIRHRLPRSLYDRLEMFLSFVWRAQQWTEAHPDLEMEPDVRRLIGEHQELARWIAGHPERGANLPIIQDPDTQTLLEHLQSRAAGLASVLGEVDVPDELSSWDSLLSREQALLEGIVREIPDALLLADMNRQITFGNPAVHRVFGYEPAELIGQSMEVLYASEVDFDREGALRFHPDAPETHAPMRFRWRHKDGETFSGEALGTIVRDASGRPVSFLTLIRDISAQEKLRAEQTRYFELLEALTNGTPDHELLRLLITQAQDARRGMIASILLLDEPGQSLNRACDLDLPANFVEAIDGLEVRENACSCGTAAALGKRVIVNDIATDERWAGYRSFAIDSGLRACWAEPIFSFNGRLIGTTAMYLGRPQSPSDDDLELLSHTAKLAGIAIDRSHAATKLADSEERLRLALKASNDAVWDWDLKRNRLWVNQSYLDQFGDPNEHNDPIRWWKDHLHPDDVERVLSTAEAQYREDTTVPQERLNTEYRLRRTDGGYAIVQDRILRTVDEHGKPIRFIGAMVDQTERRALEKEVLEAAAAEAWRIGNDLHDGVGQELTGMGMLVDALQHSLTRVGDVDASQQRILNKLADSVHRTLQQVRSLARGMNPVDVDREGLMSSLTEMAERVSELRGVRCVFQCPDPIFPRDNRTATELYRIAQEATTNAIKHGRASKITIILEHHSHRVLLQIIDDGVGLPEDETFERGLGMRTMEYRSGQIGGQIDCSSAPSGGTIVTCSFPRDFVTVGRCQ